MRVHDMLEQHPGLAMCRDPEDGETSTSAASRIGRKTITKALFRQRGSGRYC